MSGYKIFILLLSLHIPFCYCQNIEEELVSLAKALNGLASTLSGTPTKGAGVRPTPPPKSKKPIPPPTPSPASSKPVRPTPPPKPKSTPAASTGSPTSPLSEEDKRKRVDLFLELQAIKAKKDLGFDKKASLTEALIATALATKKAGASAEDSAELEKAADFLRNLLPKATPTPAVIAPDATTSSPAPAPAPTATSSSTAGSDTAPAESKASAPTATPTSAATTPADTPAPSATSAATGSDTAAAKTTSDTSIPASAASNPTPTSVPDTIKEQIELIERDKDAAFDQPGMFDFLFGIFTEAERTNAQQSLEKASSDIILSLKKLGSYDKVLGTLRQTIQKIQNDNKKVLSAWTEGRQKEIRDNFKEIIDILDSEAFLPIGAID